MSDEIRVILPDKYDLVVGDTFQLFYRGVVEAPNPFCYDILAVCEQGKNFPRYFEFTPEKPGKHRLIISVYDAAKKLLGSGETILDVAMPRKPVMNINILCIGDSLTTNGEWPQEAYRRLTSKAGSPKGLGLGNISFVGGCGEGDVRYEGYGGWRWDSYSSEDIEDMWVFCEHDKTAADQHSIWEDSNGNLWKLETIVYENLKFIPYDNRDIPMVKAGVIIHKKNAVNKDDIVIKSTYRGKPSPFYDEKSGGVNFKAYTEKLGIEKLDAVYILLGLNGVVTLDNISLHCQTVVRDGKLLVDKIHAAYPEAKIKVMGCVIPSPNGGTGTNYGAIMPHCDDYGLARYVMELNIAYREWAREPQYSSFLEYINISGQFDSDHAFPKIEKPVNTRSSYKEFLDVNGVHPTKEGYMQIADAAFRNMVHLCVKNR